jgi:hypothetical protein
LSRFENFCFSFKGLQDPSVNFPLLLFIDHPFASRWRLFQQNIHQSPQKPSVFVASPSRNILDPYLKPLRGAQGILMKENTPAFTASLNVIILCFLGLPPVDPEILLKSWSGCLAPKGVLFFLFLGEMSFYELFQNPSFEQAFSSHQLMSQRAVSWMEGFEKTIQEEWISLKNPSFFTLKALGKSLLKENEALTTPLFAPFEGEKSKNSLNHLTLHFVYGGMRKLEQTNDL